MDVFDVIIPTKKYHEFIAGHLRMEGHSGINPIQQVLIGKDQTYILFARSFGDLHSYVRNKKRLKESEAVALFHQIVTIVKDCHNNGIILRDLKLRKFLFSDAERTQLKLESLEDAVTLDEIDDDELRDKHGCPAYVSPEILSATSASFSGRSADCWSLGIILYTMLVGRYPFHDSDPTLLFGKIRRGTFIVPDSLSMHAKCLIRSILRKEPTERLTAEEILDHKWFKYMSSPSSNYFKFHSNFMTIRPESTNSYDCSSLLTTTDDCKLPDQTVPESVHHLELADLNDEGPDEGSFLVLRESMS